MLVDDSAIVRGFMRRWIEEDARIDLVKVCSDGNHVWLDGIVSDAWPLRREYGDLVGCGSHFAECGIESNASWLIGKK